jgi:hypothetical protein
MGLEKLDFKNVKRYLGKIVGHILKANDMEHLISQIQSDLIFLKALKCEMKTSPFYHVFLPLKNPHVFISHLGAFKIIKSGCIGLM